MSRRGRSGHAISLFAFQDIITSVTAIVIVVVLLLALDLTQQKEGSAGMPLELADELERRIESVRTELDGLKSQAERADDFIQSITNQTLEELRAEIEARQRDAEDITRKQDQQAANKDKWQSREQAALLKKSEQEALREKLEEIQRELEELAQQASRESEDRRPLFSLPLGINKTGWLAVVEADRISTAPFGIASKPRVFASSKSIFGDSAAELMDEWIRRERHRDDYFLVLIRPDGAETYSALAAVFASQSISFGYDVIDATQQILDPERGAAP